MNYTDYYLEASKTADKIASGELTRSPSQDAAAKSQQGFASRRPKQTSEAPPPSFEDTLLMYMDRVKGMRVKPEQTAEDSSGGFSGSDNEKMLLAKTLQAEAGNQGPEGMLAVGAVIANRAKSGKWGDSLKEVIMAPGQFSAWNSVTGYAKGEQGQDMEKMKPSEEALKAAELIMSGSYKDPTGGAKNYFAIIPGVSEKPKWANDSFKKFGDHYFGNA